MPSIGFRVIEMTNLVGSFIMVQTYIIFSWHNLTSLGKGALYQKPACLMGNVTHQ